MRLPDNKIGCNYVGVEHTGVAIVLVAVVFVSVVVDVHGGKVVLMCTLKVSVFYLQIKTKSTIFTTF